MNDAPDPALSVLLEHFPDLVALGQVNGKDVNLRAVLVLLGRVRGESITRELGDTLESLWRGVVVVVDRDDLVPPRLLESVDDVRACRCQ